MHTLALKWKMFIKPNKPNVFCQILLKCFSYLRNNTDNDTILPYVGISSKQKYDKRRTFDTVLIRGNNSFAPQKLHSKDIIL